MSDFITPGDVEELKQRLHIFHSSEDTHLERLLASSAAAIKTRCGIFNFKEDLEARELVFERARYAYNDSLEFFDENFLSDIHTLGFKLMPDPEASDSVD